MKGSAWALALVLHFFFIGPVSAEPVRLRFSWWGSDTRHKATLEAIGLYQRLNPRVEIQAEYGGPDGYQQKMRFQLSSGTAPDIMQFDQTWLDEVTSKGDYFLDLATRKDFDLAAFDPGFLADFCTFGGQVIGAPTGVNGQVLLVNKTAAAKLGVDTTHLSTWDGLLEEGRKLHTRDKNAYLLSQDTASFMGEVVMGYVKQLTGRSPIKADGTLDYSLTDLGRALTWLRSAVEDGVIQPPGEAALYSLKGDQNPKWINQQIVCVVDWASNYTRYMAKGVDYLLLLPPILKDAKTGASTVRPSQELCINKASSSIVEAVRFTNWFLNDPEAAKVLGDVRSIPASSVARRAASDAGRINAMTAEALSRATSSRKVPDSAAALGTPLIEILNDVAMKVESKVLTPEQGAAEMIQRTSVRLVRPKVGVR